MKTAVLLLTYRRFYTAEMVFNAIREAKPPRLYFASNAPNLVNSEEIEKVGKVRNLIRLIDWPCEIKTRFLEEHLPVEKSVSSSLDWFFEHEEQGIILEDDCLPHPDFFTFCEILLDRYADDERIGMVCGTNLSEGEELRESYYFSRYPHIWGWASWRRVWKHYDIEMEKLDLLIESDDFRRSFYTKMEYNYWADLFRSVRAGRVETWDAQVVFMMFSQGMLSIFPYSNLVSNIGFGSDAVHTTSSNSQFANLKTKKMTQPVVSPKFFIPNYRADRERKKIENIGIGLFKKLYLRIIHIVRR